MDGNELRRRRMDVGLSQAKLARLVGVNYSTISYWETDKRQMSVGTQDHLLAVFAALAAGEEPPAPREYPENRKRGTTDRIPIVREFIRLYLVRHHFAPTVEEIRRGVGFAPLSIIKAMEAQGLVQRDRTPRGNTKARSLRLTRRGT